MPRNYWTSRIEALAARIRRGGWRVTFKVCKSIHGHCDYIKREIIIDSSDSAFQAFLTLCHEAGHRKAFLNSKCKWPKFIRMYPITRFRELQAIVYGWEYVMQYTDRLPQSRWLSEHRQYLLQPKKPKLKSVHKRRSRR